MYLRSNVCVVGNGVIGKTAALGLAQSGLDVTLLRPAGGGSGVSSKPLTNWDIRVYALNHVARSLLSSLKIWDALDRSRVAPVDTMNIHGMDERYAGNIVFDAYSARTDALAWIVEDRHLNLVLDAALRFAPNVRIMSGQATGLDIDNDVAKVQLDIGDTVGASLLVGADGAHSWVRGQCDIGIDYRPYAQRAVVTNFACEKPHRDTAYQWFAAADGIVALLPLPGQQVSLVWSAPDTLADALMNGSAEQLAERVTHIAASQLGRLTPLPPATVKDFPLALIRPHAVVAPRVALVGDAAHVVHPLAGHGMNLGFADVAVLLEKVAGRGLRLDCGDERVLSGYARARKEEVLLMQIATDGLERLFSSGFEPLRLMRGIGLNLVDRLPVLKRRLISHALGKPLH